MHGNIGKLLSFGQQYLLASLIMPFIKPIEEFLLSFKPMLEKAKIHESEYIESIFFPEVFIAIKYILNKNNNFNANPGEIALLDFILNIKIMIDNIYTDYSSTENINNKPDIKSQQNIKDDKLELKLKSLNLINQILEINNEININFLLKNSELPKRYRQLVKNLIFLIKFIILRRL